MDVLCLAPVVSKTFTSNFDFQNSELKASPIVLDGGFRSQKFSACMLRSSSIHEHPFLLL